MNNQLESEEKRTRDIVADMTRQYKSMEEELINREGQLSTQVTNNEEELKRLQDEHKRLSEQKADIERQKNEEIKDLRARIEQMSSQFAEMLKETLHKMQDRIEAANQEWEQENDANMLRRFEEMNTGGAGTNN